MRIELRIADALRVLAIRLEESLERGRRSKELTADDLLQTMLTIADKLDPPISGSPDPIDELVIAARELIRAGEGQVLTQAEWDRLRNATDAVSPV